MSFTKTVSLPVTPDEAFALVTQPERLRRWQAVTASVDLRAGGAFRWAVTPGHVAGGTFREVEPGKRVVFGWGWEGSTDVPVDASVVTITIDEAPGGSTLTLVHEGLDEQQAAMHAEGWDHYTERLVALATTGDAGPDEWAFAPQELDQLVAAEAALAALQPVMRNLTVEDRPKPTPCTDFTAHELVEHLFGSLVQLGGMAGAELTVPEEGDVENKVSVLAGQAIAAWRRVDLDGTVAGPGGEDAPAAFFAGILPLELLLHGWDLAEATGQRLHVSDEVVDYVRGINEATVAGGRGRSFADEVAGVDGSALDRFAAYAGRTRLTA